MFLVMLATKHTTPTHKTVSGEGPKLANIFATVTEARNENISQLKTLFANQ